MSVYLKSICANVMGVENDDTWNVIDMVDDLALCHFKYSENSNSNIRGIIVDTVNECIVAPSFGYHEIFVSDTIEKTESGFVTTDNTFSGDSKIYKGVDGIILRAFLHKGKFYLSSFKKIDVISSESKLYDTDTYWSMYQKSGGPSSENLFDKTKKYSAFVYNMLVVNEDVLTVSKIPTSECNKVYLLHTYEVFKKGKCEYNEEDVDWMPSKFDFVMSEPINLDKANQFLKYGYYPDLDYMDVPYQAQAGEYVAFYENDENDDLKITMVHSRSYHNRFKIKRSMTNLKLRFFQLTNYARSNLKDKNITYHEMFPGLVCPPPEKEFITLKSYQERPSDTFIDKVFNIWINFVLCLPLSKQAIAKTMYETYLETQRSVSGQFLKLYLNKSHGYQFKHKRIRIILENIRNKYGRRNISKSRLKSVFDSTIKRETGTSLYLMDKQLSETPNNKKKVVIGSKLRNES